MFFFSIITTKADDLKHSWDIIKKNTSLHIVHSAQYQKPYRQPLSNLGWEDGIHISRDGLNLYCIYIPIDLFSYIFIGKGKALPYPVNSKYNEDNPHIERLDENNLVLFFDSDNRPGTKGSHDIWYSTSKDNGMTWANPKQVSSINTSKQDHQPHLFLDNKGVWYLYYSSTHVDGKLGIFRSKLSKMNDWNSWINRELIIDAGNTAGIGEPTLTAKGDISFVVVYENPSGTEHDRYEADPWFLPRRER